MNKGIRFANEFKQDAVAQVVECEHSVHWQMPVRD